MNWKVFSCQQKIKISCSSQYCCCHFLLIYKYVVIFFSCSQNDAYSSEKVKQSANFIKAKLTSTPKIGIICGSGLSGIADQVTNQTVVPYKEIPSFVESTGTLHCMLL